LPCEILRSRVFHWGHSVAIVENRFMFHVSCSNSCCHSVVYPVKFCVAEYFTGSFSGLPCETT
ncbi:MAG: hypothetical protein ACLFPH_11005, partial [Bacteroidales bacterium]